MSVPKPIDGKLAILAVVALGVAGAAGGWWYQQGLQRRPIRLWGHEAAAAFVNAPRAELWRLERESKTASTPDFVAADGQAFRVAEKKDVSQARGFLHLRHSLLSDPSFDWSADDSGPKNWRYALRFAGGDHVATVLISEDFRHARLGETSAEASIAPIASGVKKLFDEQLEGSGPGSP